MHLRIPSALAALALLLPAACDEGVPSAPARGPAPVSPGATDLLPDLDLPDPPTAAVSAPPATTRVAPGVPMTNLTWVSEGPGPTNNGQVENLSPNGEVVGSIHAVVAHPSDPDVLYVGATNGGLWKTVDAQASQPHWEFLSAGLRSLSIGALEMDPTDTDVLLAGIGHASSYGRLGSPLNGLLLTDDAGATWTELTDPLLLGENMTGVAVRGSLLLTTANRFGGGQAGGLFRSVDGGVSWGLVSGTGGLPLGACFDLVADPTSVTRYYVSVEDTGIYRSDDAGATWVDVSQNDPLELEPIVQQSGNNNTEMAVAPTTGRLYVAVLINGRAEYIGFTDDQGTSWMAMDLPATMESDGDVEGLNPTVKPGGQGSIHFAIRADPTTATTIYVSGDRQDGPFPNFIGAVNYTGRSFRGDTTVAPTGGVPSPQWEHLTHSNAVAAIPGGGTASGSAPHADSRELVFDALGNLIETNDGGVYRRTSPTDNTGDWSSLCGDLRVTELHNVAYDPLADVLLGGAQDTGTPQQITAHQGTWDSVSTADGGDVAIDASSAPGLSIRYSSYQFLSAFRRRTYDAQNQLLLQEFPSLTVLGGGAAFSGQFTTPVELNVIDPTRLVIFGANSVYESLDRGDTLTEIGPGLGGGGFVQNAVAYGGRSGGLDNLDVIYLAAGADVYVRTTMGGAFNLTAAPFPGNGDVGDLVPDGRDWTRIFVTDDDQVFLGSGAGASWTDVTGSLGSFGVTGFRTLEFVKTPFEDLLVVGTNGGVYATRVSTLGDWKPVAEGLPSVPVWDLEYVATDDVLAAATLGRGAWTLRNLADFNYRRATKQPR